MTEQEYLMEMLCCLPLDLLKRRKRGSSTIPKWLAGIATEDIDLAIQHYGDEKYVAMRAEMEDYY